MVRASSTRCTRTRQTGCGNDDCGQMRAWYVLSALGFYPVTPGSTQYVVGSPFPERRSGSRMGGNSSSAPTCLADGGVHRRRDDERRRVTKSYLDYTAVTAGGALTFEMSEGPEHVVGRRAGRLAAVIDCRTVDRRGAVVSEGARIFRGRTAARRPRRARHRDALHHRRQRADRCVAEIRPARDAYRDDDNARAGAAGERATAAVRSRVPQDS